MRELLDILAAQLGGVPTWVVYAAGFVAGGAMILGWMSLMALVWTYGERRIAGLIQHRLGPNRVGPWGILQPIADGLKLLAKEDVVPAIAHRFLYTLAPLLVFVGALIPFAALPFTDRMVVVDMELALYYILAFEAIEVIGVLMAGWAPGSKWSLYGGMRLAAQLLSYEIPMGICALIVIVLAGSLNLGDIVAWQSGAWVFSWAIFKSPAAFIAFFLFYVGGLASTKRAPFDLPEAESELVAGYHTEYAGMRFSFFFMAEYASMYLICALAAILFLGGWYAPIPLYPVAEGVSFAAMLSGELTAGEAGGLLLNQLAAFTNLVLKAFVLYFIMIWVRWTLPRIRIDQVMYLCLKVLLPVSLVLLVVAVIQAALF